MEKNTKCSVEVKGEKVSGKVTFHQFDPTELSYESIEFLIFVKIYSSSQTIKKKLSFFSPVWESLCGKENYVEGILNSNDLWVLGSQLRKEKFSEYLPFCPGKSELKYINKL